MKVSLLKTLALTPCIFFAAMQSAQAGSVIPPTVPPLIGHTSNTETRPYAGLAWTLGEGYIPSLIAGVTVANVESGGKTQGADFGAYFNLENGFRPGKVKLNYINGNNHIQGALGLGFNFLTQSPFLDAGLNAPFVNIGLDAYFNQTLAPFATIKTQGSYKKPSNMVSCPQFYFYDGTTCALSPE